MPRNYITAFPDLRGQGYERSVISETQASPLETGGDIYGITGSVITSGVDGVTVRPVVRRYRYRLMWNAMTTEQAVDIEHAVDLCADGTGGPLPFIEWERTDQLDYDIATGLSAPLFFFPVQSLDEESGNLILPVHWWDVQSLHLWQGDTGESLGSGWPTSTPPGAYAATADDSWLGNLPSLAVDGGTPTSDYALVACAVVGRRIRMVTVEPGSYSREKNRPPDQWTCTVTLIEKETGTAPGYRL